MFRKDQEAPNYDASREAAKITLGKISSFAELNAASKEEADEKFSQKTRQLWQEFAVSGVMSFDKKTGQRKLQPYTDLDGNTTLKLLEMAGIDTADIEYIHPGTVKEGKINLDTGNILGVQYDEETDTAIFDHHIPTDKEVTSTAEIMYNVLADLGLLKRSKELDRLVDFVTKMDNRQYKPEEFLRSAKTIIGLQRHVGFDNLLAYFKDHETPTEELTPEEFEKYGLKEAAEKQQKIIDEAMETLARMEKEGKIIDSAYGKIVVNENNELKVGASAAYVKYDGIINYTPNKSFAVTLKEKNFAVDKIKEKLGDKFQGKIIRGKMWIYNEKEPLKISLAEIIECLK